MYSRGLICGFLSDEFCICNLFLLATIADAVIPGFFWQDVIFTINVICAGEQLAHY